MLPWLSGCPWEDVQQAPWPALRLLRMPLALRQEVGVAEVPAVDVGRASARSSGEGKTEPAQVSVRVGCWRMSSAVNDGTLRPT